MVTVNIKYMSQSLCVSHVCLQQFEKIQRELPRKRNTLKILINGKIFQAPTKKLLILAQQ